MIAVSVNWICAWGAPKSFAISGNAGRYKSVAKGPVAVNVPRTSTSSANVRRGMRPDSLRNAIPGADLSDNRLCDTKRPSTLLDDPAAARTAADGGPQPASQRATPPTVAAIPRRALETPHAA